MNKILNVPEDFVSETLEGILLASNQKLLSMDKDNRVIVSNYPCKPNKVGIVTAGGSGHLPTFLGYAKVCLTAALSEMCLHHLRHLRWRTL